MLHNIPQIHLKLSQAVIKATMGNIFDDLKVFCRSVEYLFNLVFDDILTTYDLMLVNYIEPYNAIKTFIC